MRTTANRLTAWWPGRALYSVLAVLHAVHYVSMDVFLLVAFMGSAVASAPGHLFSSGQSRQIGGKMSQIRRRSRTRADRIRRKGTVHAGRALWPDFLIDIRSDDYCIRHVKHGGTIKGRCL